MSKLLTGSKALFVLPELACKIGLHKAIVLQQLHWASLRIGKWVDTRKWVRNSCRQWKEENFPFWSEDQIQKLFSELRNEGFIVSRDDLNIFGCDRTKSYAINYLKLKQLKLDCIPPNNGMQSAE